MPCILFAENFDAHNSCCRYHSHFCFSFISRLRSRSPTPLLAVEAGNEGAYELDDNCGTLFQDISATGTQLILTDDDNEQVNFGFDFDFYGSTYNDLFVGSNGFITFTGGSNDFSNEDFSAGDTLDDLPAMAVYWDDWNPADADSDAVYWQVQGAAGSQTLTVQWNQLVRFLGAAGEDVTFQAVIHEDTTMMEFRYLDLIDGGAGDNGASATIGIHDGADDFLQHSFNTAGSVIGGQSICIEFVEAVPEPATAGIIALAMGGLLLRRKK